VTLDATSGEVAGRASETGRLLEGEGFRLGAEGDIELLRDAIVFLRMRLSERGSIEAPFDDKGGRDS
jgi:hypothetical protein